MRARVHIRTHFYPLVSHTHAIYIMQIQYIEYTQYKCICAYIYVNFDLLLHVLHFYQVVTFSFIYF